MKINHDAENIVTIDTIYKPPHKPKEIQVWQGESYFRLVTFVVEPTMWRTRKPDRYSTVYPAKKWLSKNEFFKAKQQ
jgi:hypothetical protein